MDNIISKINQILSGLSGWLMIGMTLLLVADVLFRAIGVSINGLAELSVFVMIIVIYFGLARCEEYGEHVNLELVSNQLPPRAQRGMHYLAQILAIVTIALILYAVLTNAIDSFTHNESLQGTLELHIWPIKGLMVVGLVVFLAQAVAQFIRSLSHASSPAPTPDVNIESEEVTH